MNKTFTITDQEFLHECATYKQFLDEQNLIREQLKEQVKKTRLQRRYIKRTMRREMWKVIFTSYRTYRANIKNPLAFN